MAVFSASAGKSLPSITDKALSSSNLVIVILCTEQYFLNFSFISSGILILVDNISNSPIDISMGAHTIMYYFYGRPYYILLFLWAPIL